MRTLPWDESASLRSDGRAGCTLSWRHRMELSLAAREPLLAEIRLVLPSGLSALCFPHQSLAWLSLRSLPELTWFCWSCCLAVLRIYRGARLQLRVPASLPAALWQQCSGCNALPTPLGLAKPGCSCPGMFGITAALSHLCARLVSVEESILKVREENSVKYQRTFLGSEMIDWLIQEGEVENRQEAVELGRALLEHGIIQHVSNRHHFFDSDILYHFWINFRRRRRLTELLNENSARALSESPDSPFCLRKLNPEPGNTSFLSVQTNKEIKVVSAVRRSSITSLSGNSNTYFSAPPTLVFPPVAECNPKSVLKRPVTTEELLSPGAPYVKKTLTIVGDAVGWGFVVRGGRPCHIQAVDPGGPAAAAGMKVCQFVFSVNGVYVLHLDYQTISSLIMTGPRTLVMEVMEAIE
ncbi:DEP domain-containing mTOR-interacting protein-like isoform X1 [Melospiza georgiana]|uniref:DEP domain-containing mTOR-interacting protein-like isoform X1 n=1 Tax=Melospiza georgiana TaxID=44398 RepID=UPI0025AD50AD|nr:DEP domain-containing mTOR-interacting protein-like isoform X1 [Melospiza georgiana]